MKTPFRRFIPSCSLRALLATLGVLAGLMFGGAAARAQLASETALYTFGAPLGFFGPLDYPPLIEAPGISNDAVAIYGLTPVTGEGDGGAGVFVLAGGSVNTVYTDPVASDVTDLFTGDGGSTAYAISSQGLVSLPGGTVVSSTRLEPIIKASDGTFYGFGTNDFERITAGGAATIASLAIGPIQLIQASDGNFYAIGVGSFVQITQNSTVTTLYSFPDDVSEPAGIVEVPGSGGESFYGFRAAGSGEPGDSGFGIVFLFTANPGGASSTLTILHDFGAVDSVGLMPNSMLVGTDGNLYGTTERGGSNDGGILFRLTPQGEFSMVFDFDGSAIAPVSVAQLGDGNFYVVCQYGGSSDGETIVELQVHPPFFAGETALGSGVDYLSFPDGGYFGYYSYLTDPHYIYHFDLGYEYLFDANDGMGGLYLYDFASNTFFYTSLEFPFPYLYDFTLNSTLYYYPDTTNPGHYTTNPRYFFDFGTGTIITK